MATAESLADAVKHALSAGAATPATVSTLHALLGTATTQRDSGATAASTRAARPAPATRRAAAHAAKVPKAPVRTGSTRGAAAGLSEAPTPLAPKARYALATEAVNISLRVLSDAARPRAEDRALQARCADASPGPEARVTCASPSRALGTVDWTPTAECARLALSHLRATDAEAVGVKSLPPLQLEKGALALAGRLVALRLGNLAAKELHATRRRLQRLPGAKDAAPPDAAPGGVARPAAQDGLASLLQVDIDPTACPQLLPLLVTYHAHVLGLIASARKPSAIEQVLQYLHPASHSSPCRVILAQFHADADRPQAVRQLDTLCRCILRLCPSTSTSADEAARTKGRSPAPLAAFKLQTLALRVRKEMWKIAEHQVDGDREVAEPVLRYLGAFLRRSPANGAGEAHGACVDALESLDLAAEGLVSGSSAMFAVYRTLSDLAGRAGMPDTARMHADQALHQCSKLGRNHARYVAALARRACLGVDRDDASEAVRRDVDTLCECLRQSLLGSASDYEVLLVELNHICVRKRTAKDHSDARFGSLVRASGGFACRFAQYCPGKQAQVVADLLALALYESRTNDDLVSWVRKDAVTALIQSGALKMVGEKAATMPMARAWSSTTAVLALSRALKALVLRWLTTGSGGEGNPPYDDEALAVVERGALLELQLKCALDLSHKPKYRPAITKLLPELLRTLSQAYTSRDFPIRRARIAALALRVREQYPDLLAPYTLQVFQGADSFDEAALAHDQGLKSYASDVKTSLAVSRALLDGNVKDSLTSHLTTWQTLIDRAQDAKSLELSFESPAVLLSQLVAVSDYFDMLGDDEARLPLARMISQIELLWGTSAHTWLGSLVRLASAYLSLGYAEKAGEILDRASQAIAADDPGLEALQYHVHRAHHRLAIDKLDDCRDSLVAAARLRDTLQPDTIRHQHSKAYKLMHARGWLVYSQYLLGRGCLEGALNAAKRAVKLLNAIWSGIENQDATSGSQLSADKLQADEQDGRPVDTLARGVRKLNLRPAEQQLPTAPKLQRRGAAYWPAVRMLCDALCHLSDVFVQHGIYPEANCASERAVKIATASGSSELVSRARYHRCTLLTAAGKVEEAELCLAQDQENNTRLSPLGQIEELRARAAIAANHGDVEDAIHLLDRAAAVAHETQCDVRLSELERFPGATAPVSKPALEQDTKSTRPVEVPKAPVTGKDAVPVKGILRKGRSAGTRAIARSVPGSAQTAVASGVFCLLRKINLDLRRQKAILAFTSGRGDQMDLTELNELTGPHSDAFATSLIEYAIAMRKVTSALQADFAFNVLPESTLSCPALQAENRRLSLLGSSAPKGTKNNPIAQGRSRSPAREETLGRLLLLARRCINAENLQHKLLSTHQAHTLFSMLSDASLLLSATSAAEASKTLHPVQEAMGVDLARILAAQCQLSASKLEVKIQHAADLLTWPQPELTPPRDTMTARSFQREYIDILPRPWTAVSLSLNEACDELYVVRYRSGRSPMVLRLPFSRQRSEDADDDLFDFAAGKRELQEIIRLSNYSCHRSLDTSVKGAKTKWWSEREALDKRLQELVINMENVWFGGFKGIFSHGPDDGEKLDRFRTAFDVILSRHLASRRTAKKGISKLALDDQVLQLFLGLGHDHDGAGDVDEALQDLLYFTVDILQFNGERNAYDEIDFDSMAMAVLDALRDCHEDVDAAPDAAHLVLVLDRRLQAFPWENLPCLERCSVSRVDSMLTLRDRIAQMRKHGGDDAHYTVSRQSGSYILNPSGDLKSTQDTLSPELKQLAERDNHRWSAIVGKEPSEDEFQHALRTSSTLLYFGHGAGLQYIRPRSIKKVDECSEVVWLMGCSSGAVTEYHELEAFSVPLAYMMAGHGHDGEEVEGRRSKCMAVMATLWDVTDKDIDRFSLAVGEEWGLWSPPAAATTVPAGKTPRKHRPAAAVPCTPEPTGLAPNKTPPPAKKSRAPSRSRTRVGGVGGGVVPKAKAKQSLVEAVAKSRDACYLRYLNGAAPVVFGVPVYLGD